MSLMEKALEKYAHPDLEPSNDELREIFGDEWTETDRRDVIEARQIEKGIVPKAFTDITDCKFCGPVFIYPGYPNPANNCPWCFNRIKGLSIPREQR